MWCAVPAAFAVMLFAASPLLLSFAGVGVYCSAIFFCCYYLLRCCFSLAAVAAVAALLLLLVTGDFSDPYLGIQQDAAMINYNAPVFDGDSAAADAARQQQLQQQRRQQQVGCISILRATFIFHMHCSRFAFFLCTLHNVLLVFTPVVFY